jgi:uncharacterized integral membrane protein (TIGR00697 family)
MSNQRVSAVKGTLTLVFVFALMTSNIFAVKQVQLPFGITVTAGIIVFPITYVLSDVFSEVYGYRYSRRTAWIAFICNLAFVLLANLVILLPAPLWFENSDAFRIVYGSTPRILFASFTAYQLGDLLNDKLFQKMKERGGTTSRSFAYRAFASSIVGEVCDATIFCLAAFIGEMPVSALVTMIAAQVIIKLAYEALVLPLTNVVRLRVERYEVNHG